MTRPTHEQATKAEQPTTAKWDDAGIDAAVQQLQARRQADEAALIRAQQERAQPAVDRARAAVGKLEAFEQTFGRQLAGYRDQLQDAALDHWLGHGQRADLLARARREVAAYLAAFANVPRLKATIARIEHLDLKDITPWNETGRLIDRLTGMSHAADTLPADLTGLAATMAEIARTLERLIAEAAGSPRLDPEPPPARVDASPSRPAPTYAKGGAVTHGADDA
jgi:hypothetical protein